MKTRRTTHLARTAVPLALLTLSTLTSPVGAQVSGAGETPGATTPAPPPLVVISSPAPAAPAAAPVAPAEGVVLGESVRRAPPYVCVPTPTAGSATAPAAGSAGAAGTSAGAAGASAGEAVLGESIRRTLPTEAGATASAPECREEAVLGVTERRAVESVVLPRTGAAAPLGGMLAALMGLSFVGVGFGLRRRAT